MLMNAWDRGDCLAYGVEQMGIGDASIDAEPPIGICSSMCPAEEIEQRIAQFIIHPLEATEQTAGMPQRRRKCDPRRMVKCYSRPAAGKEFARPELLRPFSVLQSTVAYLVNIIDRASGFNWSQIYEFTMDRLRAVRQDIIVQQLSNLETLLLLGPMLKFCLYARYRCEIDGCGTYDSHLHDSQTNECIDRLLEIYFDQPLLQNSEKGGRLFRLILLHRMHTLHKWAHRMPDLLLFRKVYRDVFILRDSYLRTDFVKFFRLFARLSQMERLSACAFVPEIRRKTFLVLRRAYARSKIPTDCVTRWLGFVNRSDSTTCLTASGFKILENDFVEADRDGSAELNFVNVACWHRWTANVKDVKVEFS